MRLLYSHCPLLFDRTLFLNGTGAQEYHVTDTVLLGRYNGILVGLALATFQHEDDSTDSWDGALIIPVVLYSGLSVVFFGALGRLLVPYKVPPYTLPFNFASLMYGLCLLIQMHY
jgi:urea transporter